RSLNQIARLKSMGPEPNVPLMRAQLRQLMEAFGPTVDLKQFRHNQSKIDPLKDRISFTHQHCF
ncbi:hypothetical protein, partial [Brevundimonas sp.]|uniref:hypothetical protein n=1 Tax=Brevundimonas sp. TaxID=1871086 RepID=UPI002899083C